MLDSYGLTPKSPQTNFEMMDEEVRSSSAAALPWQAPRFSPMLTCAPPAQPLEHSQALTAFQMMSGCAREELCGATLVCPKLFFCKQLSLVVNK